jgi:hypothetical protein
MPEVKQIKEQKTIMKTDYTKNEQLAFKKPPDKHPTVFSEMIEKMRVQARKEIAKEKRQQWMAQGGQGREERTNRQQRMAENRAEQGEWRNDRQQAWKKQGEGNGKENRQRQQAEKEEQYEGQEDKNKNKQSRENRQQRMAETNKYRNEIAPASTTQEPANPVQKARELMVRKSRYIRPKENSDQNPRIKTREAVLTKEECKRLQEELGHGHTVTGGRQKRWWGKLWQGKDKPIEQATPIPAAAQEIINRACMAMNFPRATTATIHKCRQRDARTAGGDYGALQGRYCAIQQHTDDPRLEAGAGVLTVQGDSGLRPARARAGCGGSEEGGRDDMLTEWRCVPGPVQTRSDVARRSMDVARRRDGHPNAASGGGTAGQDAAADRGTLRGREGASGGRTGEKEEGDRGADQAGDKGEAGDTGAGAGEAPGGKGNRRKRKRAAGDTAAKGRMEEGGDGAGDRRGEADGRREGRRKQGEQDGQGRTYEGGAGTRRP